jgi:hypothetical protein
MDSARTQQKTAFIVGEVSLPSHFLAIEVYSCGAEQLENTSTVLLCGAGLPPNNALSKPVTVLTGWSS